MHHVFKCLRLCGITTKLMSAHIAVNIERMGEYLFHINLNVIEMDCQISIIRLSIIFSQ